MDEGFLFHQLADRSKAPVFQLAHVKMSGRRAILRPTQEDIACGLHGPLTFDDPLARVTFEFRPKALQDGFRGFLDLKKQWGSVAAHEQADGAERTDAPDAD